MLTRSHAAIALLAATLATSARAQLATTAANFQVPGSGPSTLIDPLIDPSNNCMYCHGNYDENVEPYTTWTTSMMAQSFRDPIFRAAMTISNQDAAFSGTLCLRCHAPAGNLDGQTNPDGSHLSGLELHGTSCTVCHRMVNPVYTPGESPDVDEQIIADQASNMPVGIGNGALLMDPYDRRRGPFSLPVAFHEWLESPYHESGQMCGTCHDASNPAYVRQPGGGYTFNALGQPHPTNDKHDQFPLERTYSEWENSTFAQGPIDMNGRYGGNETEYGSCQECHMPVTTGTGCNPVYGSPVRDDVPRHLWAGGNSWALRATRNIYGNEATLTTKPTAERAEARTTFMLQAASDLELTASGNSLNVRIINQTGHKLPTGIPEGRRMWINVQFFSAAGELLAERGRYDGVTATLDTTTTKVYEAIQGLDAYAAAATNMLVGPSFHSALNNYIYSDNRIPPRGFTNAAFEAAQCAPVGYSYVDGQYWDDTTFTAPPGAVRAEVRVFQQTTSREYIEFLADANTTNTDGQVLFDQWNLCGKSTPTQMTFGTTVVSGCTADFNGDGDSGTDMDIEAFFACLAGNCCTTCASADFNGDGDAGTDADIESFFRILAGGSC